jgi:hypothetical protein
LVTVVRTTFDWRSFTPIAMKFVPEPLITWMNLRDQRLQVPPQQQRCGPGPLGRLDVKPPLGTECLDRFRKLRWRNDVAQQSKHARDIPVLIGLVEPGSLSEQPVVEVRTRSDLHHGLLR